MAKTAKIQPPFAWLGRFTVITSIISAIGIGAFFRFFQLGSLPPGLDTKSANIGLQVLDLIDKGILPGLNAANGYAPLWIWLQALSVKTFGNTELALRLWPALLGTLAILAVWLWARSWFSVRIAWLTALLLAVTPWAVTLSRNGSEAALFPLLVPLTLWLATLCNRKPGIWIYLALASVLTLDLLSGPLGWLLAIATLGMGSAELLRKPELRSLNRPRIFGLVALGAGIGAASYTAITSMSTLKDLPDVSGLTASFGALGSNLVKTLLMFNVHGDENYHHNLAGEPLLNAFVGLMLIAGILVGVSRLHQVRYRRTFILGIVLLLPAVITTIGTPNAGRAVAALPFILLLAAIGISYMLELWYTTFPINSAARAIGQSAVLVLLALTVFQGYTQYFRAWGSSSEVYTAYNEGAVQIVRDLIKPDKTNFTGQRYIVATPTEQPVTAYLSRGKLNYQPLQAAGITSLPIAPGNRQFIITAKSRDEATKILRVKLPGGVLRPHYSGLNLTEIYYIYEVTK